jgi:hypothetical protein
MSTSEATAPHVYRAITAVTAAMAVDGISKARENRQQGYSFRGIDDIYNALASVLAKNHLCILPRVLSRECTERTSKNGGVVSYVVLDVEFTLISSLDGSAHTIRTVGEAMDSADKATNKAMSAAMKYACLMVFQIPTEGDNDADAHHPEKAAPRNGTGGQQSSSARDVQTGSGGSPASRAEAATTRRFESDKATVESLLMRADGATSRSALGPIVDATKKAYADKKLTDQDYSRIAARVKARSEALGNGRSSEREMTRQPGED